MTINKNSVEQINVALLDMDKKIKSAISNGTSAGDFKNLEASVDNIKRALNEAKAGLEPGKTYDINISGNAATADKATTATTAEIATTATTAETATTATNADHALTADKATKANNAVTAKIATTAETATNATTAETATTANKVSNALTVNGKTYNGSEAVDAGVQTVANGGTGVTTQADINRAFIGNLDIGESDVTDGTEFVSSWASDNGFAETTDGANTPYKRQFVKVWNYIKGKISSVLGLTANNYGDIQIGSGNATGSKLTIQGLCVSSNSYTDANPKLVFKGDDGSQNISLTFTDFDAVQPPASLTLNGNQGNEYFIAPCIKANNKMRIPIGAPSSLEDGCIWIER